MKNSNNTAISGLDRGGVVTVGMFDGVHAGHRHILRLLKEVAERGGYEPVVVTFDRHPREVLGNGAAGLRVLSTAEERYEAIRSCGIRHIEVCHFTHETAQLSACRFAREFLVDRLNMKALVLGYDNMFGSKANNDFDQLPSLARECGFDIVTDTAVTLEGVVVSSTLIRRLLADGDVRTVGAMLERPYELSGTIAHGRQVGRTIGFPTANVQIAEAGKVVPKEGVYAVDVFMEGEGTSVRAMANLGPQPTFGCESPTFEVHLLGVNRDCYGSVMRVLFLDRLRDTRRFDSVDALVAQLERDKDRTLKLRIGDKGTMNKE